MSIDIGKLIENGVQLTEQHVAELAGEFGKSSAGQIVATLANAVIAHGQQLAQLATAAVPEAAPVVAAVEAAAPLAEKSVEELQMLMTQVNAALHAKLDPPLEVLTPPAPVVPVTPTEAA